MNFPEDFLHYVWQFKSYDARLLKTNGGEDLRIIHQGYHNKNAGPDFSSAKIQIGATVWAGNVEIHIKSSDWLKHNHQTDSSYDNVILHVVYEHDVDIERKDGSIIPVLVLNNRIEESLIQKYENLFLTLTDFPCKAQIAEVDQLIIDSTLSRTLLERFEQKSQSVLETLNELNGNWDETFYRFMARNFGFKVNALPFELLAKFVPQQIYGKHKGNAEQIEALVFGAAGFLNDHFIEEYPASLKKEFKFLQQKYKIIPVEISMWKFMRMRPQNFPTIRLAQFTALIVKQNHLFSKMMEINDVASLSRLFDDLPVNTYWQTHYHFKKETHAVSLQIGKSSVNNILLNTVALFLFAYGMRTDTQHYIARAIKLLESLPPEDNAITNLYTNAGVQLDSAFSTQGILHLKKQYCDQKKCLSCGIGINILKQH